MDKGFTMIQWQTDIPIYLHIAPVDFRKSINGLSVIVSESMDLPVFKPGLFVFCNRQRDKLKVLYWDNTGFALWYKRLEKDKFKWPKQCDQEILALNDEQWDWLLRGLNILALKPHQTSTFSHIN